MRIDVDTTPIYSVTNAMAAVGELVDDRTFQAKTRRAIRDVTTQWFGDHIDRRSVQQSDLSHVYEWNQVGTETGRLWRIMYRGSNGEMDRIDYDFVESKEPVEREEPSNVEDYRREHIFHYKAWALEEGFSTTIEPVEANVLAIVQNGEMIFRPAERYFSPRENIGAFTEFWTEWWLGIAPSLIETRITDKLGPIVEGAVTVNLRRAAKQRNPAGTAFNLKMLLGTNTKIKRDVETAIVGAIYGSR